MENLSIQDAPPPGQPGQPQQQQQQQQQQQMFGMPSPGAPPAVLGPGRMPGPPQQQMQQLPAQMFTTAAQLLDLTDKKLMLALRDGRKMTGILRSWDQFANLVLQSTRERIFVPPGTPGLPDPTRGLFADIDRGLFLVRGENVLLLGEIDLDKDDDAPEGYDGPAEPKLVEGLAKARKEEERRREKKKVRRLAALGFEGEGLGEVSL